MTHAGHFVARSVVAGDSIRYSDVESSARLHGYGGELEDPVDQPFAFVDLACFGDYDNSTEIERSNHRVMRREYPELVYVYGSHGSEGLGYLGAFDDLSQELREAIGALADYPILDESDASELEMELEGEAWESYGRSDFCKALAELLDERHPSREHDRDDLDRAGAFEIWRDGCDAYNVNGGSGHTIESGGGVYYHVDEWVKRARDPEDTRYPWSDWSRGARAALDAKLADLSTRAGWIRPTARRDWDLAIAEGLEFLGFGGWLRDWKRADRVRAFVAT